MISDLPCVLFAGGKSSRMGEDKSLLPFGDFSTLAEYQYRRLVCLFERVYLSSKDPEKFGFGAPVLVDPQGADFAPTAGFVSAFRSLKDERIMALSVDTPFVGESVFETLIAADNGDYDAIIARTVSGSHPLCGIYRRTLQEEMERMLREGDHRLGKLLSTSRTLYVPFTEEEAFANLNHPHEYQQALSRFCAPDK
ncbi:MAG: molybdenum cofactor guanylyltransferase MobA [Campylobacterota bacterium]